MFSKRNIQYKCDDPKPRVSPDKMKLSKSLSPTQAYQVDISNGLANVLNADTLQGNSTPALYSVLLTGALGCSQCFLTQTQLLIWSLHFSFPVVQHTEYSMVVRLLNYPFKWCSAIHRSCNLGGLVSETKSLSSLRLLIKNCALPTSLLVHANLKNNTSYKVIVNVYCFYSLVSGLFP